MLPLNLVHTSNDYFLKNKKELQSLSIFHNLEYKVDYEPFILHRALKQSEGKLLLMS